MSLDCARGSESRREESLSRLDLFDAKRFDRGRPAWVEVLWLVTQGILVDSWIPGTRHRAWLLRLFGARLGRGIVIKPHVRVKFPWRLSAGDHCWIGEGVWIDNLDEVVIGDHVCISQNAYLCTGSHDWSKEAFDLVTRPIEIRDHAWIGAKSVVAPGVCVGEGAVLGLGSVATSSLTDWKIHRGNPAIAVRPRTRQVSA